LTRLEYQQLTKVDHIVVLFSPLEVFFDAFLQSLEVFNHCFAEVSAFGFP